MSHQRHRRFPIGLILFVLFTVFTLLEIWLILMLASATGWLFTIFTAIASAVVGSYMAKREGLSVMARFQGELSAGRLPTGPLADGVLVLIGGALLITPGLITDLVGFTTLVPACRGVYVRWLKRWAAGKFTMLSGMPFGAGVPPGAQPSTRPGVFDAEEGTYTSSHREQPTREHRSRPVDPDVVEGEYRRVD